MNEDTQSSTEYTKTTTKPIPITGRAFSTDDEDYLARDLEARLRYDKYLQDKADEEAREAASRPIEPPKPPILRFKHRRHWFELLHYFTWLWLVVIVGVGLGFAYIWYALFQPEMPTLREAELTLDVANVGEFVGEVILFLIDAAAFAMSTLVIVVLSATIGIIPWLMVLAVFVAAGLSVFRNVKDILLWCFTWIVVTDRSVGFLVKLPEGKAWERILTALQIQPGEDALARESIIDPKFAQGFFGKIFHFGTAKLESSAQTDLAFQDIRGIPHFDEFKAIFAEGGLSLENAVKAGEEKEG